MAAAGSRPASVASESSSAGEQGRSRNRPGGRRSRRRSSSARRCGTRRASGRRGRRLDPWSGGPAPRGRRRAPGVGCCRRRRTTGRARGGSTSGCRVAAPRARRCWTPPRRRATPCRPRPRWRRGRPPGPSPACSCPTPWPPNEDARPSGSVLQAAWVGMPCLVRRSDRRTAPRRACIVSCDRAPLRMPSGPLPDALSHAARPSGLGSVRGPRRYERRARSPVPAPTAADQVWQQYSD